MLQRFSLRSDNKMLRHQNFLDGGANFRRNRFELRSQIEHRNRFHGWGVAAQFIVDSNQVLRGGGKIHGANMVSRASVEQVIWTSAREAHTYRSHTEREPLAGCSGAGR